MSVRALVITGLLLVAGCATQPSRSGAAEAEAGAGARDLRDITVTAARGTPNFATISYGSIGDNYLLPLMGDAPVEWYCGCDFDPSTKTVDWASCGFSPVTANDGMRGRRIEWEHVVPRSWSASAAGCSTVASCGGPEFNRMVADPYALVPAVGALNGKRSNNVLWEVEGESRPYGRCDFEVGMDADGSIYIEPPDHLKGDLARITLYMVKRYRIKIPIRGAITLYKRWSRDDPVDDREREWIRAIHENVADWKVPYDR